VTIQGSDFSLACIVALALFVVIMAPRSLFHLATAIVGLARRSGAPMDRWLVAMALAFLACAGLALATGEFNARAHTLVDRYEVVILSFLFFAAPPALQVARAWFNTRRQEARALSHALSALAVLALPASMAIPTAALMQAQQQPAPPVAGQAQPATQLPAAPTSNSAAAEVADDRYFTDNEFANDPVDYPQAAWLAANTSFSFSLPSPPDQTGRIFYQEIPLFTGFWFDQTADALSLEATDTFGALISRITYVRANWAFALAVFIYKLLSALVLVAVSFDAVIAPLAVRFRKVIHRGARGHAG
jgi:hypothetical protein